MTKKIIKNMSIAIAIILFIGAMYAQFEHINTIGSISPETWWECFKNLFTSYNYVTGETGIGALPISLMLAIPIGILTAMLQK